MNADHHQQQQQQQQQQQAVTASAVGTSVVALPPSASQLNGSDGGGGGYGGTTAGLVASMGGGGGSSGGNGPTTYVTIGMPANISTMSTPPSTSTFKTPLLPMPTLEDIEVATAATAQPPPGILKYPQATSIQQQQQLLQSQMPPTAVASGPLKSNVKMLPNTGPPPTARLPLQLALPLPLPMPMPMQLAMPTQVVTSTANKVAPRKEPPPSSQLLQHQQHPHQHQHPHPHSHQQQQQQRSSNQSHCSSGGVGSGGGVGVGDAGGWCSCFGTGSNAENGNGKIPPPPTHPPSSQSYATKSKKRKQRTQSIWSALLTNLGICTLLLAYTLLGSFIFLTIENEDSALLHQQHSLASTKRSMAAGDANIYQRQQHQQQQQQHHMDNDTVAAAVASPESSSKGGAGGGGGGGSLMLGSSSSSNVDFVYGEDATPQFALSPDTYDVRQRTIENIWDITVSLNILYKENWTKLAALEIAKFQDQLIKRLNEDVILQLSQDDMTTGGHAHYAIPNNALGPRSQPGVNSGNHGNGNGGGGGGGGGRGGANNPATEAVLLHTHFHHHRAGGGGGGGIRGDVGPPYEWNFAKAFLYSLTVLTTIGYGNIAPRTTLGRLVTICYAFFGIPLTLVYLSSTGSILAKVAREVFSKALCCCLCSNCGYCCYDEKRMAEKERRMKRKRQQEELHKQQAAMQEPYYVRDVIYPITAGTAGTATTATTTSTITPEKQSIVTPPPPTVGGGGGGATGAGTGAPPSSSSSSSQPPQICNDIDTLSASESRGSMHGLSILAPILLCFTMMIIYIVFGAAVLYRLENWPIIDGIYFCFMSLSTIGFGDMLPGLRHESNTTTWFCSIYIMSGMTLTAMCFNVIHEEIVHRIRIVVEFKNTGTNGITNNANNGGGGGGVANIITTGSGSMMDMAHDDGQYYMPAS